MTGNGAQPGHCGAILQMEKAPYMNKNVTTIIVDIGVLMVLLAISFGIWFYPWITLVLLALVLIGVFGQDSG